MCYQNAKIQNRKLNPISWVLIRIVSFEYPQHRVIQPLYIDILKTRFKTRHLVPGLANILSEV